MDKAEHVRGAIEVPARPGKQGRVFSRVALLVSQVPTRIAEHPIKEFSC